MEKVNYFIMSLDIYFEFLQEITWKKFGYPDKGASETTLWIGNKGAHTPAHQDTYGYNIVAQVHGKYVL